MLNANRNSGDIFEEGFKALLTWIVLFGFSLVALGLMIFYFPALIGFIFAAFILFAGAATLYGGYRIWKLRRHVGEFEVVREPVYETAQTERPRYYSRRVTFIVR